MQVYIYTITFLNNIKIKKNKDEDIVPPEWKWGVCEHPEDSKAAYSIWKVMDQGIKIRAYIICDDPGVNSIRIRAIDSTSVKYTMSTFQELTLITLGFVYPLTLRTAIPPTFPGGPNILGEVNEKVISLTSPFNFTFGVSDFTLETTKIINFGIGIHDIRWQWQYRLSSSEEWKNLSNPHTSHRIYVIIKKPREPWESEAPWTDVLEYSCRWAMHSWDVNKAAKLITENVYNLGEQGVVDYDYGTNYALGNFDCSAFIERLQGGIGLGLYINCSDCATIVSTFANILGCNYNQSRISSCCLNYVDPLGTMGWVDWICFSYHEVAWKGACSYNDELCDACLLLDGDSDPGSPPHEPLLPVNMSFVSYREKYAEDPQNCVPNTSYKTRRDIE